MTLDMEYVPTMHANSILTLFLHSSTNRAVNKLRLNIKCVVGAEGSGFRLWPFHKRFARGFLP